VELTVRCINEQYNCQLNVRDTHEIDCDFEDPLRTDCEVHHKNFNLELNFEDPLRTDHEECSTKQFYSKKTKEHSCIIDCKRVNLKQK